MGDVGDCEGSDPMARARVKVTYSSMCTGRIELELQLGTDSDVRAKMRLSFSVTVRHV